MKFKLRRIDWYNLAFYLWLVKEARRHIIAGDFSTWKNGMVQQLNNRL